MLNPPPPPTLPPTCVRSQRAMQVRVEVAQMQRRRRRRVLHQQAGLHQASHTSARLLVTCVTLDSCKQEGAAGALLHQQ